MASSDSSSSSSSDSLPSGREIRRELVWLKEKVKSTPRGHNWDLLNRDGRVQEVCFTTGMSRFGKQSSRLFQDCAASKIKGMTFIRLLDLQKIFSHA